MRNIEYTSPICSADNLSGPMKYFLPATDMPTRLKWARNARPISSATMIHRTFVGRDAGDGADMMTTGWWAGLRDAEPRGDVGGQIVADAGAVGERNRAAPNGKARGLEFAPQRRVVHLRRRELDERRHRRVRREMQ